MKRHTSREAWLQNAIQLLYPLFSEQRIVIPNHIRVTVGFGPQGSRQESTRIMGGTLHTRCTADGAIEIFISPESAGAMDMLVTLTHELIHAVLLASNTQLWWAHGDAFGQIADLVGLIGPRLSGYPDSELEDHLETVALALGAYPGAQVSVSGTGPAPEPQERASTGPKPQKGSRYLLLRCVHDECQGFQLRITQRHLDFGRPACPSGHTMSLIPAK